VTGKIKTTIITILIIIIKIRAMQAYPKTAKKALLSERGRLNQLKAWM
jgi:hypothetical protein